MADYSKKIWNFLYKDIKNEFGVAGLMGNIQAESGLNPKNMENAYEKKLGFNDDSYTKAVDDGSYANFAKDSCGYGLCQWTFGQRKQNLLDFSKKKKKSIGDLNMQLEFLLNELKTGYKGVYAVLCNATSIKEASDAVMVNFERPADQSDKAKDGRAKLGKAIYDKFATFKTEPVVVEKPGVIKEDKYRVATPKGLNVRKDAGMQYPIIGALKYKTIVVVIEKKMGWGKIAYNGKYGWICLEYTENC